MLRVLKAGNASAHRAGNSSVTFLLRRSAGSVAFRPKDSACLSLKLLRNVAPNAESRSVRCGSVSVLKESPKRWRAKKELKKNEKIKCSAGDFLAGDHICGRIFDAS